MENLNIDFLFELVSINSQTKNISGVNQAQSFIESELKTIGFQTNQVKNSSQLSGNLLHGIYRGQTNKYITIICHADTVFSPKEVLSEFLTNNDKIYGSGIADDKGGVYTCLNGLRKFISHNPKPYYSINFICSPNEEVGSTGFHDYFEQISNSTAIALGFEPALNDGSIISSRNGNRWYTIKIKGKSAHSGRFNVPFVNAAHELSILISKLHKLNDEKNKIRVQTGTINAGSGHFNVICGEASAKIDVRYPCRKSRDLTHTKILKLLSQRNVTCYYSGEQCLIDHTLDDDCPPLKNEFESTLIEAYVNIINKIENKQIVDCHTGGAADINYFSRKHNISLCGLGPIGGGLHTSEEFIQTSSLNTRSEAFFKFLEYAQKLNQKREHHNSNNCTKSFPSGIAPSSQFFENTI